MNLCTDINDYINRSKFLGHDALFNLYYIYIDRNGFIIRFG
jgi:hypothetical protein